MYGELSLFSYFSMIKSRIKTNIGNFKKIRPIVLYVTKEIHQIKMTTIQSFILNQKNDMKNKMICCRRKSYCTQIIISITIFQGFSL